MHRLNHTLSLAFAGIIMVVLPCAGQESSQPQATVTGSGSPGHIAVWKSSTTLTNSVISQSGGGIGIGTNTPAAKLEVNGNAQVDGNFTLSGSILETGVGQLIWAPNDGSGNFSVGLGALPATTSGHYNTAGGDGALQGNTSGVGNTATGYEALFSNTTGGANVAIGLSALSVNNIGSYNTAVGENALQYNTAGNTNTAIGVEALGSNISGDGNTAIGMNALVFHTDGCCNTANGFGSLQNSTTGLNNIAIGVNAGYYVTNLSNNIHIGNQGTSTDNGTIRIGCTSNCFDAGTQTTTFVAGIYGQGTGLGNLGVVVDANGNLGTVQSSRRYKENIHDMADSSDGLMNLRPVSFRYKKAYEDGSKPIQYGLIAEEVAEVYPDLVARSADGQIESVRYQLLDPMLLNELQKQHATIAAQKEQIRSQAQNIRSLEERLVRVEAMLAVGATGVAGQ